MITIEHYFLMISHKWDNYPLRVSEDHSCEYNISDHSYDWGVKERPWRWDGDDHCWWSLMMITDDYHLWWSLMTDDLWWWWSLTIDDHWSMMITDRWWWWSLITDDDHWTLMMINFIYVGDDLWVSIMLSLFSGDHHRHLLSSDNHHVLVSSLTIIVMFYFWWSSVWKNHISIYSLWPFVELNWRCRSLRSAVADIAETLSLIWKDDF